MEDSQIVQLYFHRSEDAISQTQRKYGAYLQEIAYNILRSQEDSEEVVGDTYLAAWNAIPPEKPRVLRHFLSRITRNLSFDRLDYHHAQKRNTHMTTLLSELEDCLPDARQNVEAHWETKQITVCLNRFLSTLPKIDCAIFVSRYFYGKTTEEISGQYGLPPRKVTYRLSRLRQQLRCRLEQEGIAV